MHGNRSDAKWPLPPKCFFLCREISSHLFGYNQPRLSIVSYIYMFHAPMSIMKRGLLSFEEFNWLRPIFMSKIRVQNGSNHVTLYLSPVCFRKKYTRPSNIKAAAKSSDKHDAPVPTNSRTRRSLDKVFDFETDCLVCGKDATVGIKLELTYWKSVSNCETLDLQGSVRSQCLKRMRSGVGLC